MVVLAEDGSEYEQKGFDVEKQSASLRALGEAHGMPIDDRLRPRMHGTARACRAVVAARVHRPDREESLLRALRVRHFCGQLLDDEGTIAAAAVDAGIPIDDLDEWLKDEEVGAELERDKQAARHPTKAALAMDARLAGWEEGRRYTCPSFEFTRIADDLRFSVPGFQPYDVYWATMANLCPSAEQRPAPERVEDVLEWAAEPVATVEVAAVCEIDRHEARERLSRVAHERPVGQDGYWLLVA
jgi:hypothetical protein